MIFNGDMTIWILAVGLLVSVALAGWRQGAIRAAFSLVGILFAYWLAEPVGGLFQPLLPILGVGNPILTWAIAPVIGFALVSAVFKFAAFFVHHRVEMYYKYKAGDLRLALWERLNSRLGICLGLVNGAAYFILVSFCLFNLSYATTQVAVAPNQPASIQWVNQLGQDLQATGVAKAATAVATLPPTYYKLADVTGLLMQNPQASQRLADYPALMSLYERDDIQALLQDSALTNALAGGTALGEILNNATVRGLLQNKELFSSVQGHSGKQPRRPLNFSGHRQVAKIRRRENHRPVGIQRQRDHCVAAAEPAENARERNARRPRLDDLRLRANPSAGGR